MRTFAYYITFTFTQPCSCSSTFQHSACARLAWILGALCFVNYGWSAALQAYPRHRVLKHNACVMRRIEKSQGSRLAHIVLPGSAPCLGWSTSAKMVHRVPISIESEKNTFLVKNNVERRQLVWKTFIRWTPRPQKVHGQSLKEIEFLNRNAPGNVNLKRLRPRTL